MSISTPRLHVTPDAPKDKAHLAPGGRLLDPGIDGVVLEAMISTSPASARRRSASAGGQPLRSTIVSPRLLQLG